MPVKSAITERQRLIYMKQTQDGALYKGIYAIIFLVVAVAFGAFHYKLMCILGSVAGMYFALGAVINWFAYVKHRKQTSLETAELSSSAIDDSDDAGMIVKKIDLGLDGLIKFSYPEKMPEVDRQCAERMYELISGDTSSFMHKFSLFKESSANKYPKYSAFIRDLRIHSIDVFKGGGAGGCAASVVFKDGISEIWRAEFVRDGFSDLIWQ